MNEIVYGATKNPRTGLWGATAHTRVGAWTMPLVDGVPQAYKSRKAALAALMRKMGVDA